MLPPIGVLKTRLVCRAAGFFPLLGVPVSSGRLFISTCRVCSHATPAAWNVVNVEYLYFLAAGWVHTLMTDKFFAWMDATALRRMSKLDLHHMASGPCAQAMLDMFQKMHRATEVFPWTMVVKNVIRRDTRTRAANQVHVHSDSSAEYGFILNYPCRGFA